MRCTSCNKSMEAESDWVMFDCPSCGREKIRRCRLCRKTINPYTCSKCGFSGP
jgi:predicted RNA-binding Zn-ribbon protein involved in translation (DUF1610 family)